MVLLDKEVKLADGCWVGKSMGSFSGTETAGFVDGGRKKRENMKLSCLFPGPQGLRDESRCLLVRLVLWSGGGGPLGAGR